MSKRSRRNIQTSLTICARSSKVEAIDLNRLKADVAVAVAKTKRRGQLRLLGHSEARIRASRAEARLETFSNRAPSRDDWSHFDTDGFTSVCPLPGPPDFASIET